MAEFREVMKQLKRMCEKSGCQECAINWRNNEYEISCDEFVLKHTDEAEKIIMDWAKEHPIKTNADKFMEVFGLAEMSTGISECNAVRCPEECDCTKCKYNGFWSKEYQEPKKV